MLYFTLILKCTLLFSEISTTVGELTTRPTLSSPLIIQSVSDRKTVGELTTTTIPILSSPLIIQSVSDRKTLGELKTTRSTLSSPLIIQSVSDRKTVGELTTTTIPILSSPLIIQSVSDRKTVGELKTTRSTLSSPHIIQSMSDQSPFDFYLRRYEQLEPVLKMLLIMDQYCGQICNTSLRLEDGPKTNSLCAVCYCDDDCYLYEDCCPDKYLYDNRTRDPSLNTECVSHNLKAKFKPLYYMIHSCPQSAHDDVLAAGCVSNTMSSLKQVIPVTDQMKNINYRNIYCAECNGVSSVKPWRMKIDCSNYTFFTSAESFLDLYQIGMESKNCSIIVKPDSIPPARKCSSYSDSMITTCNVTGKWRHYEEKVVIACNKFFYPIKEGTYKNVFCYVCNTDLSWYHIKMETEKTKNMHGFALTALFDFDDSEISETQNQPRCQDKEFYDSYNDKCRKIVCPLGKVIHGKECTSLVQDSSYFRYVICMKITARVPIYNAFTMLDTLLVFLSDYFDNIMSKLELTISSFNLDPVRARCENNTVVARYFFKVRVYAEKAIRDVLERNLSDLFKNETFSTVHTISNQTFTLSVINQCFTRGNNLRNILLICNKQFLTFVPNEGNKLNLEDTLNSDNNLDIPGNQNDNNFFADLIVSDMLWCAQVELNFTEYSLDITSRSVVLDATNKTLTQLEYQITDTGTVRVCLSHLQNELIQSVDTEVPTSVPSSTAGIVSLVCTCISLTFLILSVIVYIIIPNLRTSVSKYNLTLALNLVAAQTLFEFGAEQIQFPIACQIIGILAHYFWLTSVFCMNACTFNLFYRICYPFQSRVQSEMKVFILLCLYSFISPGLIVIITALSNYFVLGVSGYGNGICYLSNGSSRKYGFAIPIGILVSANILLFFYTIITICRLPKLKSTSDNKINLIMCVNLSTITGASWLFGYLYEASGFIGFAYCFSIFLGSIGFFLFLSFFSARLRGIMRCRCCPESVYGLPPSSTTMVDISSEGTGHI